MTMKNVELAELVSNILAHSHTDTLREMLSVFLHQLMEADVQKLCGANYGESSPNL